MLRIADLRMRRISGNRILSFLHWARELRAKAGSLARLLLSHSWSFTGQLELVMTVRARGFATGGRSAVADRHVLRGTCRRRQRSSAAVFDPSETSSFRPSCDAAFGLASRAIELARQRRSGAVVMRHVERGSWPPRLSYRCAWNPPHWSHLPRPPVATRASGGLFRPHSLTKRASAG